MKIIGMSGRSPATHFWSSRPLRPGRETSSMRQLGTRARGQARNSCADANVSGCQPSERISNSSDSRTETSSSTTNTIGVTSDIVPPYSCPRLAEDGPLLKEGFYQRYPRLPWGCYNHYFDRKSPTTAGTHADWQYFRYRPESAESSFCNMKKCGKRAIGGEPIPKYRRYYRPIVRLQRFCSDRWRRPIQSGCASG